MAGAVTLVLLAAPLAAARAPEASRPCGTHEAVRRSVHRLVTEDRIPGAAVLVNGRAAEPGCARWSVTDGVADLRTGRRMNTTDRLRIGSITKTFTATVVLQLAAEHRLSLGAPVERYLPGLIQGMATTAAGSPSDSSSSTPAVCPTISKHPSGRTRRHCAVATSHRANS